MITLSWSAIQTKSPTMDEPLHSIGAFVRVFHRDFRINPEDPPLWNHWAMLGESREALQLDFEDPDWKRTLLATEYQSTFCTRSLFQSSNDGVAFIQRGRTRMVFLAAILAAVLAWWSWRIAGAAGAVAATTLLCLDPNFIAHAPLVKNDLAMTLIMLALAAATWSVGRVLSGWNVLLPGIVMGFGLGTKFSAVLLGPMLVVIMLIRALLPGKWRCFGRDVRSVGIKLIGAAGVCAVAAIVSWLIVWASYGFRFEPTHTAGVLLPTQSQVEGMAQSRHFLAQGRWTTPEHARQIPPGALERSILWLEEHRLMPQAWLYGLLFTYRTTLVRGAFLLGMHSDTGWWYYFPLAMLFKTPLATILSFVIALAVAVHVVRRRRHDSASAQQFLDPWTIVCLLIPPLIYLLSAMTSNLNLGLRHILPVYPFLYIFVAIAAERLRRIRMRTFRLVAVLLAGGLAVESFVAFPNYIAFFNAVFKPHRIKLLSDSNLDWGQDLPLLADWRRRNPTEKLYFGYFGTTDSAVYGIEYLNIPGGFWLAQQSPLFQWPDTRGPGVLAISATLLQGVNTPPSLRYYYAPLRAIKPMAILGGSIYLYQLPLPAGVELTLPGS